MADVLLGFDPGTSLTKIIYKLANKPEAKLLFMEPQVLELPEQSVRNFVQSRGEDGLSNLRSEDGAWIKEQKRSENAYVVGFLAQMFQAEVHIQRLKYESAIYKIMAAVGSIVRKEYGNKSSYELSVNISALLPYGEYSNREQLKEQLRGSLKRFYFQDFKIRASLENFFCYPEGGGLAIALQEDEGELWFRRKNIAILVFGYRNSSYLYFRKGVVNNGKTTDLGFYQILDKIIRDTSGQDRQSLAKKVFQIGGEINADSNLVKSLIKSKKPENAEVESKQISQGIENARKEYWALVANWLRDCLSSEVDQIVICGGTAKYLEKEIIEFFSEQPIYWGHDKQKEISEKFYTELSTQFAQEEDKNVLAFRLVDVYCLSQELFALE